MKQLAYFCLEGLRTQGPHQVWVTLGMFPKYELAEHAIFDPAVFKPDVAQTRVIAVYRDSGHTGVASHHAARSARKASNAETVNSVTVA